MVLLEQAIADAELNPRIELRVRTDVVARGDSGREIVRACGAARVELLILPDETDGLVWVDAVSDVDVDAEARTGDVAHAYVGLERVESLRVFCPDDELERVDRSDEGLIPNGFLFTGRVLCAGR